MLYEDNHLIAINKQPGLLSQGDKTGDMDALRLTKAYIKNKFNKPGDVYIGLPHRLDRPVSGVLLLCRTSKALTRMNELIKKREIIKRYHAIVYAGTPPADTAKLVSYIKKDPVKNKAIISPKMFTGAKRAELDYTMLQKEGDKYLVEVMLKTGRSHQIRAQLASVKLPILGDTKYNNHKPLPDMSIALHSHTLEFIHPVKKEMIRISAAYPRAQWWNGFK